MVTIHSNRIQHGINACLKNSKKIAKISNQLLKKDEYVALVLYFYAVEEFGKALLLEKERMKKSRGKGISLDLHNHKTKFELIQKNHQELFIKKFAYANKRIIKSVKLKPISIYDLIQTNQDIFSIDNNFAKIRTSFWLVDYDENKKRWNTSRHDFIDDEVIKEKIKLLKKKIREMEKTYSKLSNANILN